METSCKSIFKHHVKDKDFCNAKGREVPQLHDNMVQSLQLFAFNSEYYVSKRTGLTVLTGEFCLLVIYNEMC